MLATEDEKQRYPFCRDCSNFYFTDQAREGAGTVVKIRYNGVVRETWNGGLLCLGGMNVSEVNSRRSCIKGIIWN